MKARAATAALLAGALMACALAAAGCGENDASGSSARLVWESGPALLRPPALPRDRVLRGEVRNDGSEELSIEAADIALLDREGRRIRSVATFVPSYVHSLYPYNRGPGTGPGRYPEKERERLGLTAVIEPGEVLPLTVSWRVPAGERQAARLDYGGGSLPVPSR